MALRCFCILRHGAHPAEDKRTCVREARSMEPVGAHRKPRKNVIVARWLFIQTFQNCGANKNLATIPIGATMFLHVCEALARQYDLRQDSYWRYGVFAFCATVLTPRRIGELGSARRGA